MSETTIIPVAPIPAPKPPRRVKRDKYVRTITLYEKNPDNASGRRETKIPATTDAAKVMIILTAEKGRARVERWFNDVEDGKIRPTPKEFKDMVEALKGCDDMIKGAMEAPTSKPENQSLILNNSVIATGGAPGADNSATHLMSIVTSAAKAVSEPKLVKEASDASPT